MQKDDELEELEESVRSGIRVIKWVAVAALLIVIIIITV